MHACTCPPQLPEHTTDAWRRSRHEACFFFFWWPTVVIHEPFQFASPRPRCLFALLAS
jgi:hypothetical protein